MLIPRDPHPRGYASDSILAACSGDVAQAARVRYLLVTAAARHHVLAVRCHVANTEVFVAGHKRALWVARKHARETWVGMGLHGWRPVDRRERLT